VTAAQPFFNAGVDARQEHKEEEAPYKGDNDIFNVPLILLDDYDWSGLDRLFNNHYCWGFLLALHFTLFEVRGVCQNEVSGMTLAKVLSASVPAEELKVVLQLFLA